MSRNGLIPFRVIHARFAPKKYKFSHKFFWFKLNLDDIENHPNSLVRYNKLGLYSFYDSDHLKLGESTARDNFIKFAKENGLKTEIKEVTIYTQLRFLGYVFNPVSFILLKDVEDKDHAIIEIGNTYNEQKPYFVDNSHFDDDGFFFRTKKYFYISPFIDHDNDMEFRFKLKNEHISIAIDDFKQKEKILQVNFVGDVRSASTKELVKQTLYNPFVTIQFIFFIHLHALVLWLKGIKYFRKNEYSDLQRGVYIWKK